MKVIITLEIDVDPEKWATEYGVEPGTWNEGIRADVRSAVENHVGEHYIGTVGVAKTVTTR